MNERCYKRFWRLRMAEPGQSLHDRNVSSFPISISTSLALESLFDSRDAKYDPTRVIPQRIDVRQYQAIYFNLLTLFRNLSASVDKSVFLTARVDDLAMIMASEIEVIESLCQVEGMGLIRPYFYTCSYHSLLKLDERIKLREDHTDWQKAFKQRYLKVVEFLMRRYDISLVDTKLEVKAPRALMLTHIPYDLLNYKSFKQLDLLESNTGKLKPRPLWNSKYYPLVNQDMSHLPFHKLLLLLFGDKTLIHPSPIQLRRLLLEVSIEGKWTVATTVDKIKLDVDMYVKDHYIRNFIKSL